MRYFPSRGFDCFSSFGGTPVGGYIMMGIGLIFIIIIIYFVVKKGGYGNNADIETPLEILKKRFVNGEIDEDEYKAIKSVLENK